MVRYENLVGDRYLEITSGPGELRKLPPGSTIPKQNTQPALDLDALLGGLRPVLKGLDGAKVNEVSNAVTRTAAGSGWRAVESVVLHQRVHPEPRRTETNSSATSSTT